MTEQSKKSQESELIGCSLLLGVYCSVFLWGFWNSGIYALGFNATVFLLGCAALLYAFNPFDQLFRRQSLRWSMPLILLSLSYSLFENPFTKVVNFIVIPVAWFIFYRDSRRDSDDRLPWSLSFLLSPLHYLGAGPRQLLYSVQDHDGVLQDALAKTGNFGPMVFKISKGLFLLAAISGLFVIPLLSSSDPVFASRVNVLLSEVGEILITIVNLSMVWRCIIAVGVSVFLIAFLRTLSCTDGLGPQKPAQEVDDTVVTIVLGGILILYSVFIQVQVERLFLSVLPITFLESEHLVKSGFWQLVFLSLMNLLLYFWCYRRTGRAVQLLLGAFTLASLVLILSAAHRMRLYVVTYGLSYEKFYASYTVLYCVILFGFLSYAFLSSKRHDVLRAATLLCFWMYGIAAVFPVEQLVLRANLAISQQSESRLKLSELRMLSTDVYGAVSEARLDPRFSSELNSLPWAMWRKSREETLLSKRFYEMNLSNLLQRP